MDRPTAHGDDVETLMNVSIDEVVMNVSVDVGTDNEPPPTIVAKELSREGRDLRHTMSANNMVSARNSTFWLQVVAQSHSDPSLQSSSPSLHRSVSVDSYVDKPCSASAIPSPDSVREETSERTMEDEIVYEHERYQILLGWGAKGCLLPMDPKRYTNATYSSHYPIFPTIALPKSTPTGSWEWTSPWQIHIAADITDKDGASTRVHYVDFHLTGRDYTFAVETSGGDYSLVLQAASLDEREDWIFAIEEAILCRESYQETHNSELKQNVQVIVLLPKIWTTFVLIL
ncbi:hypothetical protein DYB26_012398 [Aphanomyces astaci]|uniref:PH domain-containing protein n=1 Tax=Aphanomyces astaci TaxID=112090 RepID=A0A3R7BFL6_APHAT|nr:hypothetical protein DYB26_012398 [Aphanomyces astaci]